MSGAADLVIARVLCRKDDYAQLPTGATAGIDCGGPTSSSDGVPDPWLVATNVFGHLSLPDLRLRMNPELGLVALPTWFWFEGYDGGVKALSQTLPFDTQECQRRTDRDPDGAVVLDATGAPATQQECRRIQHRMTVEVRAWPQRFLWSFGDRGQQVVPCVRLAGCPEGVGVPFRSIHTPSPIAHAYTWSSLGANGTADAYTVHLGILFGAEYRFSIDGQSGDGWQSLRERELGWSTSHQVQEAQTVLRRP